MKWYLTLSVILLTIAIIATVGVFIYVNSQL